MLWALALIGTWKHYDRHSLYPWAAIGSAGYVTVANPTDVGPLDVVATAPEVDSARRVIGSVGARDTLFAKLPYADARVTLVIGGAVRVELNVDRPRHWIVTLQEAP